MTQICLVRHGETDWNALGKIQGRTDIPLNKKGIKQAEASRDYLAQFSWDAIISSPLSRARHTADIINQSLHLPIYEREEFIERCFGDAEGMTWEERTSAFPDGQYPNQESFADITLRVMNGLKQVHKEFSGEKLLLVAHGGTIGAILATLSNGKINNKNTKLENACLSTIYFADNAWKIHDYNLIQHLLEAGVGKEI
ncbi:histidine phosphatase family protein [Bacillaceae bacterium Marseille-Q3522]|nr:histidine phosphatase family protein [Bacillaceae bacterium Marseille-Q3522]